MGGEDDSAASSSVPSAAPLDSDEGSAGDGSSTIATDEGMKDDADAPAGPHPIAVAAAAATSDKPPANLADESLRLKTLGNADLTAGRYLLAIRYYSEALEHTPTNAIILSNQALAYIKVENYGLAILDATKAIESDPDCAKGYYRRGTANFALNNPKSARKDFRFVCHLKPKDRDARMRLQACEKAVREAAFAAAIVFEETEPLSATYDPNLIGVDKGYDGPHPGGGEVAMEDGEEEASGRCFLISLVSTHCCHRRHLRLLPHWPVEVSPGLSIVPKTVRLVAYHLRFTHGVRELPREGTRVKSAGTLRSGN